MTFTAGTDTTWMLLGALITVILQHPTYIRFEGWFDILVIHSGSFIISMAILRFFKDSNVLENNMVQTQVSAAGTLSRKLSLFLPGSINVWLLEWFPFWQTFFSAHAVVPLVYYSPFHCVVPW